MTLNEFIHLFQNLASLFFYEKLAKKTILIILPATSIFRSNLSHFLCQRRKNRKGLKPDIFNDTERKVKWEVKGHGGITEGL